MSKRYKSLDKQNADLKRIHLALNQSHQKLLEEKDRLQDRIDELEVNMELMTDKVKYFRWKLDLISLGTENYNILEEKAEIIIAEGRRLSTPPKCNTPEENVPGIDNLRAMHQLNVCIRSIKKWMLNEMTAPELKIWMDAHNNDEAYINMHDEDKETMMDNAIRMLEGMRKAYQEFCQRWMEQYILPNHMEYFFPTPEKEEMSYRLQIENDKTM